MESTGVSLARNRRAQEQIHIVDARERVVERWVFRRLGQTDHERRVVAIAGTLFDLTHHLHRLRAGDRRLLRLASLMHDVGRRVDDKTHPEVGAAMIARDTHLPISPAQRRALAYLTRYHRGAVPEIGYDDILLAIDRRKSIRMVLAILRVADALDNRNLTPPPRIVIAMKGRKIRMMCYVDEEHPRARRVYRRRKKLRLLETLLDCRIEVRMKHVEAVHTVA
jgi:exopolyphosphatase/guanosine-5'-triphosphate,3'-diphosphate pyrophosphatase